MKKKKLKVGQRWTATALSSPEIKPNAFWFRILYSSWYWDKEANECRHLWLAVKENVDHVESWKTGHPQCWWFDDFGTARDDVGLWFQLNRRLKDAS